MKTKMFLCAVLALLTGGTTIATAKVKTKVIAHRGYWKTDGSAQNSIASLDKANQIKTYGSELDVWLSSDGVPMVTHDRTVKHNGKTLVIENTPASVLKTVKLNNGEYMPTLAAYLDKFKNCKNTKLIIELKSHSTKQQEDRLARMTIDMVKAAKLQKRVEYIAFSKNMTEQLIQLDPKAKVAYLNGDLTPRQAKEMGCTGLDYHINVFKKNPTWIQEAHDLGLTVNVWTVDDEPTMQYFIDNGADYITTDEPEMLQRLLKAPKK